MRIYHELPVTISQYLDVGKSNSSYLPKKKKVCEGNGCEKFWAKRVCGPSSLAMVIAYYFSKNNLSVVKAVNKIYKKEIKFTLKELSCFLVDFIISDGVENKAYIENIGWTHQGLIDTAVKYFGLTGKRFDFVKETTEEAFKKVKKELKNGPVIASVYKNLDPQNGGHLVVVFGMDDKSVLFADPDTNNKKLIKRKTKLSNFKKGWKKRFIVIRPK